MPTIQIRDITLLERLNKLKPVPDDYYDDIIYELLKRAEAADKKPKLSALDDLPRLILEEIRKALDGKLVEALKSALLPAVSNLSLEIPVNLSIKVRLRLEPILEPVFDVSTRSRSKSETLAENHNGFSAINNNENNNTSRETSTDELERRAIEYLRQIGGCWEGSAYALARHIAGRVDYALETRLRRHLVKRDGRLCLPEAAQ